MNPEHIIIYDGTCLFCNKLIQMIYKADKRKKFYFTTNTSQTSQKISGTFHSDFSTMNSVVFVSKGKYYIKSDAVFQIALELESGWKLLHGFKIIPRFLRNVIYDFVAKNRYRIFGKRQYCSIPDAAFASKLLL